VGAIISCVLALGIFWYKHVGRLLDGFAKWLGIIMIALTIYIAFVSKPPIGEAIYRTFIPLKVDMLMIVTLVGGTVGGYISFAGAHRLLDAGIKGKNMIGEVNRSSISGITITAVMRYILFLAALGVVWNGARLASDNPAASVFQHAAGKVGYIFFGVVIWCAAITSVVGASYTSVSFWKTLHPAIEKNEKLIITIFIILSTIIFVLLGNPAKLLIIAGAVNGVILPIALCVMLIATGKPSLMKGYNHPIWLIVCGYMVVAAMTIMSIVAIQKGINDLF
jgi:Mn2+/Fe2+ NRAMP family transporter